MTELGNLLFILQMCMQLSAEGILQPSDSFRCTAVRTHTIEYHFDGNDQAMQQALISSIIKDF
tara:strand:- start:1230 stop:1418 length:189 start_codon:yes stop_codon:yes gene_type:complete